MAEIKIIDIFGYAIVGAGTLFFPLLYVLNDILTEVYGFSASRKVIRDALVINILFSALMYMIVLLPSAIPGPEEESFNLIFSLSPRIITASVISYFIGESTNAFIISSLKIRFKGQKFAVRALFSTLIASFIESIIFGYIAFYNRIDNEELIKMICMLSVIKVCYELLIIPFTTAAVRFLKKAEKLDVYERPSLTKILTSFKTI